jgi:hypothetical protein
MTVHPGVEKMVVTVWEDGTWRVWGSPDAYYARNDPGWLLEIPFSEILREVGQTTAV